MTFHCAEYNRGRAIRVETPSEAAGRVAGLLSRRSGGASYQCREDSRTVDRDRRVTAVHYQWTGLRQSRTETNVWDVTGAGFFSVKIRREDESE